MKLSLDGAAAYAYTGGKPFDAALPCIVFVHGALHDHSAWTLLARWFAHHGHSVLALDLPGHGRSAGQPPADVESAAAWVLALMSAAGVQQAAVAGHSMGSLVALEAAAQAPERITQLAMLATAYPMNVTDSLLQMARDEPLHAMDRVNALSISTHASKPSYPGPGMWVHGSNRALMRRMQAQAQRQLGINLFAHDFSICARYANGVQAAERVRCPATLVLGARDAMTSPKAAGLIAQALNARVVTLPVGHHLMAEAPDALLDVIKHALSTARA